jgi:pyruvate-ferredoxin/flavodoxin oxidoreductase
MAFGAEQQKLAVSSGAWPLFRFDPRRVAAGEPGLVLDGGEPTTSLGAYMRNETRFRMVEQDDPERFKRLLETSQDEIRRRWATLQRLAAQQPETVTLKG